MIEADATTLKSTILRTYPSHARDNGNSKPSKGTMNYLSAWESVTRLEREDLTDKSSFSQSEK